MEGSTMKKKGTFAVAAEEDIVKRCHTLLDMLPGATKEEKLINLLNIVEAELALRGLNPGLGSHLRSLLESAENMKTLALAMAKAAEEHTKRVTDEHKDAEAAKDRALADKQKAYDDLKAELDTAQTDAKTAREELAERETEFNSLRKRIEEQSMTIELQQEKNARQEVELQNAQNEILCLRDELQNAQNEIQRLMDELREP